MDSRDDERVPIDFSQAILTKTAVEHDDGGQYICMCLPDTSSRECTYSVSGKSLMTRDTLALYLAAIGLVTVRKN